ncbi:nucleotidyltransferase family protein [Euhalothece natronophila Z-M001]|uniref:Nucleotidyltransferase family protein n=1 Tax=Euhalothece natronophila Z-M001 TaxID=522448 RepID=A0A5B8NJF7_9CHRO|nr:nucleotidyltransferase family protein [Euhalothece natronophila]QDZ38641.1 nucleotidyltransferase family protein [Euhalothece natronophila Z-M001]
MGEIGIILLAAGAATRFSQPKQLLSYHGKPLLQHLTEVALASGCQPIVVVLGAFASQIEPLLTPLPVAIALNEKWSQGMASSLQCGVSKIQEMATLLDALIVMLGDQPLVSPEVIQQLVTHYRNSDRRIVASQYDGIVGVPALFDQSLIPELMTLQGDMGAKPIINRYDAEVVKVPFPEGAIDIDTPQDWEKLLNC